jgi:hypothetical protein
MYLASWGQMQSNGPYAVQVQWGEGAWKSELYKRLPSTFQAYIFFYSTAFLYEKNDLIVRDLNELAVLLTGGTVALS